ncbi:MAG: MBL fold metallo-hydrolase [Solirubrobacterales bacterium]
MKADGSTAIGLGYLGHATVELDLDGSRLLTDPVLRSRLGPLRRHGPMPAAGVADGVAAVLVSHLHRDHADLPSLRRIAPGTPLLVPAGTGSFLSRRGCGAVTELAPGDSTQVGALTVTAVEAVHGGGGRLDRRPGAAVGFLVEGSRRVYFAGDTDLFEGMAALRGVDLALLPIWGWGPNLGPGHMNPERAARAAALIEPRVVVPIHWGTLYPRYLGRLRPGPLHEPPRLFARWLAELAPQVELRVLAPGESTSLP